MHFTASKSTKIAILTLLRQFSVHFVPFSIHYKNRCPLSALYFTEWKGHRRHVEELHYVDVIWPRGEKNYVKSTFLCEKLKVQTKHEKSRNFVKIMEDLEGFTPQSQEGVAILCATLGLTLCFLLLAFLCLKIKSTKKTPELLGTVGTVKRLDEPSSPQVQFPKSKQFCQNCTMWKF